MSQKTPELSTENNRKPLPFGVCSGIEKTGRESALTLIPALNIISPTETEICL